MPDLPKGEELLLRLEQLEVSCQDARDRQDWAAFDSLFQQRMATLRALGGVIELAHLAADSELVRAVQDKLSVCDAEVAELAELQAQTKAELIAMRSKGAAISAYDKTKKLGK